MSKLMVVTGGQYGSEAKGACTAWLARQEVAAGRDVTVIRVAGPNAGHTAYDSDGRKWALRQVPVAAVVDTELSLLIGAGSEIDLDVLDVEITSLEASGIPVRHRLTVDASATIITSAHKKLETALIGKIGSTGKGIGAARADRLMRTARTAHDVNGWFAERGIHVAADTWHFLYHISLHERATVIIEGTQGFGLGLHGAHYPKCTSSDCRAVDFCAMAGVDPAWFSGYEAWVVMRTYPIRVAGDSGYLKGETTWEDLGFEPERTTVTQKIRRVGEWDGRLASDAVLANGGPAVVRVYLSMVDYVVPDVKDLDSTEGLGVSVMDELRHLVREVEQEAGADVVAIGTGPQTTIDLRRVNLDDD